MNEFRNMNVNEAKEGILNRIKSAYSRSTPSMHRLKDVQQLLAILQKPLFVLEWQFVIRPE